MYTVKITLIPRETQLSCYKIILCCLKDKNMSNLWVFSAEHFASRRALARANAPSLSTLSRFRSHLSSQGKADSIESDSVDQCPNWHYSVADSRVVSCMAIPCQTGIYPRTALNRERLAGDAAGAAGGPIRNYSSATICVHACLADADYGQILPPVCFLARPYHRFRRSFSTRIFLLQCKTRYTYFELFRRWQGLTVNFQAHPRPFYLGPPPGPFSRGICRMRCQP
jgi:hypothetical protein